jgi:hypothetical protein
MANPQREAKPTDPAPRVDSSAEGSHAVIWDKENLSSPTRAIVWQDWELLFGILRFGAVFLG